MPVFREISDGRLSDTVQFIGIGPIRIQSLSLENDFEQVLILPVLNPESEIQLGEEE